MIIEIGGITITLMGMLTFGAVIVVWYVRREWMQYVIAAAAVFPQTSAFVVLDNGFPLFYFAVVLIALLSAPYLLLALAHPGTVPAIAARPGRWPDVIGIALVFWAALITFAGPRIFSGMLVFAPELGIGSIENNVGLEPSLGNIAQLGYLTIAVLFLLLAGRLFPVDKRMVATTVWLVIILATVRLVAEPVWPRELLQTMPGFNYATPERLSGTLHEPSVLGMYLAVAAAYFAVQLRTPGRARVAALVGLAIVGVDFIANSSGTALLGLGLVAALGVVVGVIGMLASGRVSVQPWTIAAGALVVGAALTQIPLLYAMTVGYAADKTETSSFAERSASNYRSWQILQESLGAGIGLGANRPSSLLFLVLSCLGVIGFGLLVALVTIALRRAAASPASYALGWALVATLVAAGVAVPDLSAPLIWITLAGCLTVVRTSPLNPTLNPPTRAPATPPIRVSVGADHASDAPSVGGTRKHDPTSPALTPSGMPTPRRHVALARVTPKDAA